jgi:hypothetical protein
MLMFSGHCHSIVVLFHFGALSQLFFFFEVAKANHHMH